MSTNRIICISVFLLLLTVMGFGQTVTIETIVREVNIHIFDTDGQLPGFYTLTNKFHEVNHGNIKSEHIVYSNDEEVIRQFNQKGKMVKYQVYREGKLYDDFTYEYAEDDLSLLRERGTYNLNYIHFDSAYFVGINALEEGRGFTYNLDTVFVHESKYRYELTRKWKSPKQKLDKYVTIYTKSGSLLSVTIYRNEVKTGHTINKYNNLQQVIERQNFWAYDRFANEDDWSEYLSNHIYKFTYDTIGLIQTTSTEIYSPVERKWKIHEQKFQCTLQQEGDHYNSNCISSTGDYIKVEIDSHGNWIRKEETKNGEVSVSTRKITYFE